MLLLNEKDRTKKFLLHQLPITCTDNVGYVQIKLYIPVNGMLKLLQVKYQYVITTDTLTFISIFDLNTCSYKLTVHN